MTDFFSSDWHLGHDKEFIWKERGYFSLEEHDLSIMYCVESLFEEDTLWFIGDMAMSKARKDLIANVFKRCKAGIIFCRGNHDPTLKQLQEMATPRVEVCDNWTIVGKPDLCLNHFPPRDADAASHNAHAFDAPEYKDGTIIVHGHTHSKVRRSPGGAVNVCWDAWGRFPTLEEVLGAT